MPDNSVRSVSLRGGQAIFLSSKPNVVPTYRQAFLLGTEGDHVKATTDGLLVGLPTIRQWLVTIGFRSGEVFGRLLTDAI